MKAENLLWMLFLFLFFAILFAQKVTDGRATRNVRYEYTVDPKQDSIDSAYWHNKSLTKTDDDQHTDTDEENGNATTD